MFIELDRLIPKSNQEGIFEDKTEKIIINTNYIVRIEIFTYCEKALLITLNDERIVILESFDNLKEILFLYNLCLY